MTKGSQVAAIYDIHGNLPALEAVLSDLERIEPDWLIVGGDVASRPMPAEVLDRLAGLGDFVRFIRGNADREVVSAYNMSALEIEARMDDPVVRMSGWAAARLEERHCELLASFSEQVVVDVEGIGEVLFCHATPRSDEEIITKLTPDGRLDEILSGVEQNLIVCGHALPRRAGGSILAIARSRHRISSQRVRPTARRKRVPCHRLPGYRGHGREPATATGSGMGGRLLRATSRQQSVESSGVDRRTSR